MSFLTKRLLLFATLLASTCGGICAANSYKLVLTFPDSSVEVCSYTQLAYQADAELDVDVTSCNTDQIFKYGFEQRSLVNEDIHK